MTEKSKFMDFFEDEEKKDLEKKTVKQKKAKIIKEATKAKPKLRVVEAVEEKLPTEMEIIAEVLQRLVKKVETFDNSKKVERLIETKLNSIPAPTEPKIITEMITESVTKNISFIIKKQSTKILELETTIKSLQETINNFEAPTPQVKLNIPDGSHTVKKTYIRDEDGIITGSTEEIVQAKPISEAMKTRKTKKQEK